MAPGSAAAITAVRDIGVHDPTRNPLMVNEINAEVRLSNCCDDLPVSKLDRVRVRVRDVHLPCPIWRKKLAGVSEILKSVFCIHALPVNGTCYAKASQSLYLKKCFHQLEAVHFVLDVFLLSWVIGCLLLLSGWLRFPEVWHTPLLRHSKCPKKERRKGGGWGHFLNLNPNCVRTDGPKSGAFHSNCESNKKVGIV